MRSASRYKHELHRHQIGNLLRRLWGDRTGYANPVGWWFASTRSLSRPTIAVGACKKAAIEDGDGRSADISVAGRALRVMRAPRPPAARPQPPCPDISIWQNPRHLYPA